MPQKALKHLAKRAHKKMGKAEHDWEKAKSIVSKEYGYDHSDPQYWALVTGITKRMLGLKEDERISFKKFLESDDGFESYVCIEPCGRSHSPEIEFNIGDTILAKKDTDDGRNLYTVRANGHEFKWWGGFIRDCFFKGTLREYQRQFLNGLKEESESRSFTSELELVQFLSKNYDKVGYKLKPKKVNVQHVRSAHNQPKMCYNNAFKYIMDHAAKLSQMKYILGYVFIGGVPVEHAWVYDGEKYVDPTLDSGKYDAYISVLQFPMKNIMPFTFKHHYPPTIHDAAINKLEAT
jgi:hypothetical protein